MMDLKGLFNGRLFFWRMKVFGLRCSASSKTKLSKPAIRLGLVLGKENNWRYMPEVKSSYVGIW
jgi:hypothetical protein